MIISDTKGFIFLHNPKCAGTSVRAALSEFDTTSDFFWMFDEWNSRRIDKAHMPLYVFRSQFPQYFALLERYLTFMFVRDPYDRAVSAFNEVRRELMPQDGADEQNLAYSKSLNEFVCGIRPSSFRQNPFKYRHFVRQCDLAYLNGKCLVDVTMKVEDWPMCLDKLAVFRPQLAERLKAARKKNVKLLDRSHMSYLNAEARANIADVYADDFTLFDYGVRPTTG